MDEGIQDLRSRQTAILARIRAIEELLPSEQTTHHGEVRALRREHGSVQARIDAAFRASVR